MPRRKAKVWLVTWVRGVSDANEYTDAENIAAIISSRRSPEAVRRFVDLLYISKHYSLTDRLEWARGAEKVARFGSIDGVPFTDEIFCDRSWPGLYARFVDDLCIERNSDGKEIATWTKAATQNTIKLAAERATRRANAPAPSQRAYDDSAAGQGGKLSLCPPIQMARRSCDGKSFLESPPIHNLPSRFPQVAEPMRIQTFVPQSGR